MTRGGIYSDIKGEHERNPKAGTQGISRGPRLYFIIQTFSISKSYTSSIVLPGRAILEELILRIGLAAGAIFPYCPVDEAIRVRIDPVDNSVVAGLGNTHGQVSNIRRVKFKSIFFIVFL